jgi:exopolyphosphatase / guanosine-5'-triphosphate,3'-diphosphate pyrophosphatase
MARRGLPAGHPVHGVEVTTGELERLVAELAGMSPEQRRQVPGLKPERADIIVAGLLVAAELLDRVGANGVTVSGYGLREGLLLEMVG